MRGRTLTCCLALLLAALAFGSAPVAACGWQGCDDYGYYDGPRYVIYAVPVPNAYYAPPVYFVPPPQRFYAPPPVYAYAPSAYGYYYNQPYAAGYYGGPRRYESVPYYGVRRGYESAGYYGARRGYVAPRYHARHAHARSAYYRAPVRRAARRW